MKYSSNNKPIVCMQTNSTCYKGTRTMTVKGILWHSTGANNPNLKRYVQPSDNAKDKAEMLKLLGTNTNKNDWNHIYREAGVNAWIGKLADGTVTTVQTMPWNYRPWGCGSGSKGSCNNGWIQFEICESELSDKNYFNKVYKEACELTAYLCDMYNLNPNGTTTLSGVKVPVILCHQDSYKLGLGGNHSDVYHWFKKHGKTMDDVRKDVAALMKGGSVSSNTSSSSAKPAASTSSASSSKKLTINGVWDKTLTKRLQEIFKAKGYSITVDGEISNQWACYKSKNPGLTTGWGWKDKPNGKGSMLIKAMQKWAGMKDSACDGEIGDSTIRAFQKKLGTTQDGCVSNPSSMVKALQTWANKQ